MVHIGNQTSFSAPPTAPFEFALANGFDAFEWFPDKKPGAGWDDTDLSQAQRDRVRESAQANDVRISVHARWQADPLEPRSLPLFEADIALARDLGATLLNIHLSHERGLPAFVLAIAPILARTAQSGLQLSIENTPHHSPELFNELFSLLKGRSDIGMCLDIGHANLCSATHNDYLAFIDRLGPQVPLIHLHLHENWGDSDSHLTLFTGPSAGNDAGVRGLVERLKRRGFSGALILEQWPQPPALLVQARDRLRRIIGEGASEVAEQTGAAEAGTMPPRIEDPPSPKGFGVASGDEEQEEEEEEDFAGPVTSAATTFRDRLIAGDKASRSWREKLDAIKTLLESVQDTLSEADLISLSVYLRFLATDQIGCQEDGRHFRPGHHANLALEIGQVLAESAPDGCGFLLRKILPWLPSSAQSFRTAEPLTRIRDIAHRNDIPSELKREIKTTLQNKLHRCAGPEDLVVSEAILQRITAPGANYSPEFVEQFKTFHQELKEFFNARSLDEQLRALKPACDETQAELIEIILERNPNAGVDGQITLFSSLTDLRLALLDRSSRREEAPNPSAVRSEPPPTQGPRGGAHVGCYESHDCLMADVGLEDFGFVLLSQIINGVEKSTSASDWKLWLRLLGLSVTNLRLGEIEPEECGALESELRSWSDSVSAREELLRIKATVERCRRLVEDYSGRVLNLFAHEAETLGRALGVEKNAVRTFCEADIRAHLVFQISKLCSSLLHRLRTQLRLPPWDVLVTGQAVGVLQSARELNGVNAEFKKPAILMLERASGDEEIPVGVTGILLGHDLPHLSHLAVRARQAGTVFVCAEDTAVLGAIKRLQGRFVSLNATSENVECAPSEVATENAPLNAPERPPARAVPEIKLELAALVVPLQQAAPERVGAKAAGAARLTELARTGGFKTPPGLAVPFGVMERAFAEKPALNEQYRQLLAKADNASPEELIATAEKLRELIQLVEVPEQVVSAIAEHFGPANRLIVRSSANAEDLAELAGAGLYESVLDVSTAAVSTAIKTVWASLWSRRAAVSRQQTGVPHDKVHMAILIQEMLVADFSFVLHTVNPITRNANEVYEELAVGLGETLVSGAERGNPYRLVCNTLSGEVTVAAYANFSRALLVGEENGTIRKTLDYSQVRLSTDDVELKRLGTRLAKVGRFVADAFKTPLDIEGALVEDEVYLVQARPQQGVTGSAE